ncbi:VOC family protein [Mycobacterium paragordonae]|uniref:VOC family protein n=1 Tax=Mycobacterium paragordonae TaxID=1389713 RepID=A0A4R5WQL0_9MYCO|nr:VOC family protein [Mycobacterium paragordonae]MDP7736465.1 VOC family protein [Mycobacterium paragordonae]TDK92787.1 VOC family protein [Mycobacterium paragordonae]TDL04783.1 VOC family protein [Mycobacterium paragordonae]
MDTEKSSETAVPQTGTAANVASCVIRVSNLDRSLKFYCDVFACRVVIRDSDMALLLTPNGFQLYVHADSRFRHRDPGTIGVQYLMWATDSESELERIAQRLKAYDVAAYAYTQGGVKFVEGCDPDRERVIIAHPSPQQLPREVIAKRLHG